ncbi:DUF1294 domain-containing protein [Sutcliffiella rhizosphaerae]|uniref:DUF1294 domain-containing protein n=1 Tax=Sutcliffiella rhizosphaerae TaxID=2880967 RepID=A0ABN8A8A9_9BACI|nr:DUF1294 domain-containing protein [Sutcliffiella rhizosphaerae]CAG9619582.1 hypothetical protein BACCIP111883_00350 [Sutcliffiella rhizosphaerae]
MEVLIGYYLLINIIGFVVMKVDKRRAIQQKWRVPELHLWGIALLGGPLGEWIGMNTFRHKTKHLSFRLGLPMLTIIHAMAWGYYFFIG